MRRRIAAALVTLVVAALAGCGASSDGEGQEAEAVKVPVEGEPAATSYPLTIDNCGVEETFTGPPRRVLVLNGISVAESESLIALGLEDRVIANAQSYGISDVPGMAKKVAALPKGGLTSNKNFDVPAEQTLSSGADLVIATAPSGFFARSGFATREQLAAAGANTLVNPTNCARDVPSASAKDKAVLDGATVADSLSFLTLLGQVFDVQERAHTVAQGLADRIEAVSAAVAGEPAPSVLVVSPGMSSMNSNGLPAVLTGGIFDSVVRAAGGRPAFAGAGTDLTASMNAEQLAAADVDVVVLFSVTPDAVAAQDAARLFTAYPQWQASKEKKFVALSDGVYLGPANADAVEKIAKVAHPDVTLGGGS